MAAFRTGYVYVERCYAGQISETEDGYRFIYDEGYLSREDARAVSLTLPLKRETYESNTLFSFFDGLIPEGWLLNVVAHNWKLDRRDPVWPAAGCMPGHHWQCDHSGGARMNCLCCGKPIKSEASACNGWHKTWHPPIF